MRQSPQASLCLALLFASACGGGGTGTFDAAPDTIADAGVDGDAIPDADAAPPVAVTPEVFSVYGQAAIDALELFPDERHRTWNYSGDAVLEPGWVLQTTSPDTWGLPGADFALPTLCAGDTAGCDPDFLLQTCDAQADCTGGGVCRPVEATVTEPGGSPRSLCVGHSDYLYDEIYGVIVEATEFVDLASLSPFTGRFEVAIRNALTYLSNTGASIQVRVLLGIIAGTDLSVQTDDILASLTRDLTEGGLMRVSVGAYRSGLLSWNHAKIVAVDGRLLMQGGHNFWDDHYLQHSPVHDLSMRVRGEAAADSHRILNVIWEYICESHIFPSIRKLDTYPAAAQECPPTYDPPEAGELLTGLRTISLGRLGALGENASDAAIPALLSAATTVIRLSLQDLGPFKIAGISFDDWPEPIIRELSLAMTRGVDVFIVFNTNDARPGGLGRTAAYGTGWETAESAQVMIEWLEAHSDELPAGMSAHDLVCERLHLTTLRFNAGEDTWPDGANIANHAKFFIVDDKAFYMGSQNLYQSQLAQFSMIVDDEPATQTILGEYWTPLWEQSQGAAISGAGVTCAF